MSKINFGDVKRAVIEAYPSDTWKQKVNNMPPAQVWAVYYRLKREEPDRIKLPKKQKDFVILEVY